MADPPLLLDCVKVTVAWALPAVAVPIVGALGTVPVIATLAVASAAAL